MTDFTKVSTKIKNLMNNIRHFFLNNQQAAEMRNDPSISRTGLS